MHGIAVLDAGGQYCHLLARRVREAGVQSHVLPIDTTADQLAGISGIIISGGPRSVTEADSPRIDPSILSMGVPILGICYGHQLLAATMPGGVVKPSYSREYGLAKLTACRARRDEWLLAGSLRIPQSSQVWVSHGDSVENAAGRFRGAGIDRRLRRCRDGHCRAPDIRRAVSSRSHAHRVRPAGCCGTSSVDVCGCDSTWKPSSAETIEAIKADIEGGASARQNVLFFVSGGVDSTVAYKLCADALGQDRVHGVYVDTGFMRKDESVDVMAAFENAGFKNVRLRDASAEFLAAVGAETNPEIETAAHRHVVSRGRERCARPTCRRATGSSGRARSIPTRSNRAARANRRSSRRITTACRSCMRRIEAGEIVEPLAQFYKDEVREIGRALGLPSRLIEKQPFPGPGLAVRFLCTERICGMVGGSRS